MSKREISMIILKVHEYGLDVKSIHYRTDGDHPSFKLNKNIIAVVYCSSITDGGFKREEFREFAKCYSHIFFQCK
jgi:hypothetical protein